MNISVIIPNFNGRQLLEKNLPKVLIAKKNKKNNILEVIIVDDASTDESVNYLKEGFNKDIKLVIHKTNRGFASAVNTGARSAKGDLICLLNTDVIPSINFLETIVEDFEDPQVFAVSLHEKGYGPAGGKFSNGFIIHEPLPESTKTEISFWASGGSGVFRRDIWMKLKGMDEDLMPFYWEDIDLCYRAQKRGYKILWEPKANVIHFHESTYKNIDQKYLQKMKERNYLLFNWKNITSNALIKRHIVALVKKVLSHPGYIRIVLLARKKWTKLVEERKIEIKETKVADEAVFAKFQH